MTQLQAAASPSRSLLTLRFGPGAMPGALVVLLGSALGPYGLGLLSSGVLASLDPAMPVALTALGTLVGVGFNLRSYGDRRMLAAASLRGAITMCIVGVGMASLASIWATTLPLPVWFSVALLAICAADDPLAVLAGAVALAFLREPLPVGAIVLTLQAVGVTLVIAAAGWLLLSRSTSGTEQRIFVIALLLLLGGASEYLSLSALAAGLIAGAVWEAVGGSTREAIRRDVSYFQHLLLVLVLVVSGARLMVTPVVLAIGFSYLLVRLLGAIAGSAAAGRMTVPPATDNDPPLLAPGIVGLAFALNALRAAGPDAATVVGVVVVGAVGSELLAPLLTRRRAAVE